MYLATYIHVSVLQQQGFPFQAYCNSMSCGGSGTQARVPKEEEHNQGEDDERRFVQLLHESVDAHLPQDRCQESNPDKWHCIREEDSVCGTVLNDGEFK